MAMIFSPNLNPFSFLKARFFRIYPPYWFSLGIVLSVIAIHKLLNGYNDVAVLPKDFFAVVATLFLATEPVTSIKTINWVYWSLSYEVVFYLILFCLLYLPLKYRNGALVVLITISLLEACFNSNFFFFSDHLGTFTIGFFTYHIFIKGYNHISLLGFLLSSSSILMHQYANGFGERAISYLLAISAILIIAITCNNVSINLPKWLIKIGLASYSIYLIHVPLGVYLLNAPIYNLAGINNVPDFIVDSFIVLIVIFLSWLSFLHVEKPSHKFGKREIK